MDAHTHLGNIVAPVEFQVCIIYYLFTYLFIHFYSLGLLFNSCGEP